jgi:ATPase family AAA domain-containing protein 3A/B
LGTIAGNGFKDYITDKDKLINTTLTISLIALGIYSSKTAAGVTGRYIESILGKPSLVRETSRKTAVDIVKAPFSALKNLIKPKPNEFSLSKIVFEPILDIRLKRVAESTINIYNNGSHFRNILLAGPPGYVFA